MASYTDTPDGPDDTEYDWTPTVAPGDVPTAIGNLLHSTQSLQETLKAWAHDAATEEDVSNIYVLIGHQFNDTIAAFAHHEIDLNDIHCIPSDLRVVLERCLSEDPTPHVYESFIGELRGVIWKLLKGLQSKQDAWRIVVARQRTPHRVNSQGSAGSAVSGSIPNGRSNGTNYDAWLQAQRQHQQ